MRSPSDRLLIEEIKNTARRVIIAENLVDKIESLYMDLLDEATRRGLRIPKTPLTNPILPPKGKRSKFLK